MNFGKYKYDLQKKNNEAKKKQVKIEIKEIKLRPNIGNADLEVKIKNIIKFINDGDKVKITLRFRGREMAHQDLGYAVLDKIKAAVIDIAKIESEPKMEGMQLMMMLSQNKTTAK
jgi:translation initiation factor IF-3